MATPTCAKDAVARNGIASANNNERMTRIRIMSPLADCPSAAAVSMAISRPWSVFDTSVFFQSNVRWRASESSSRFLNSVLHASGSRLWVSEWPTVYTQFPFWSPAQRTSRVGGPVGSVHSGSILSSPVAWGPLSSFGFLDISANFLQQRSRRFRNSNFAVQNFMAVHIVTLHGFVSAFEI